MQRNVNRHGNIAQASMEYLVTYGWALVLIVTIASILFLVVSAPVGYACTGLSNLICKSLNAEEEDLVLLFQNSRPNEVVINPFTGIKFDGRAGYAMIVYGGKEYMFDDAHIGAGSNFVVKGIGLNKASEMTMTFTDTRTGYEQTETILLQTPTTEICNNGINDNSNALIDCQEQTECKKCAYLVDKILTPEGNREIGTDQVNITFDSRDNSLDDVPAGTRKITAARLYIFVTSVTGSPKAQLWGSPMEPAIATGWNALITTSELNQNLINSINTIKISANENSFTMEGANTDHPPKLIIITEKDYPIID